MFPVLLRDLIKVHESNSSTSSSVRDGTDARDENKSVKRKDLTLDMEREILGRCTKIFSEASTKSQVVDSSLNSTATSTSSKTSTHMTWKDEEAVRNNMFIACKRLSKVLNASKADQSSLSDADGDVGVKAEELFNALLNHKIQTNATKTSSTSIFMYKTTILKVVHLLTTLSKSRSEISYPSIMKKADDASKISKSLSTSRIIYPVKSSQDSSLSNIKDDDKSSNIVNKSVMPSQKSAISQSSEREEISYNSLLVKPRPQQLSAATNESFFANPMKIKHEIKHDAFHEQILQDIVYSFQGIDGHFLRLENGIYKLYSPSQKTLPTGVMNMILNLAQLGQLYIRLNSHVSRLTDDPERLGSISQSFGSALHDQLIDYSRFVAVVHTRCTAKSILDENGMRKESVLPSLSTIYAWSREPHRRLKLLLDITETTIGLKGGALISAVHNFTAHGDPFVQEIVHKDILAKICVPLFSFIRTWIEEGEIYDVNEEFFVVANNSVDLEQMWKSQFSLRHAMIPVFLRLLTPNILLIGKTLNFIQESIQSKHGNYSRQDKRDKKKRAQSHLTEFKSNERESSALEYSLSIDELEKAIDEKSKVVNMKAVSLLLNDHQLVSHLRMIKQYLMLGQGDFALHLMDSISRILDNPANKLSTYALTGHLETALRDSNPKYDSDPMIHRLQVKLQRSAAFGGGVTTSSSASSYSLDMNESNFSGSSSFGTSRSQRKSNIELGWDVFCLDYDVDFPISVVINTDAREKYSRIFRYLWKIKRVERQLNNVWKVHMVATHVIGGIDKLKGVIHRCHLLRSEIMHFVNNLSTYIMFEVLETAWIELQNSLTVGMKTNSSIQKILNEHERFLQKILQQSLVLNEQNSDSESLPYHVDQILNLALRFCDMQDRLFAQTFDEIKNLTQQRERIDETAKKGEWGVQENGLSPEKEEEITTGRIASEFHEQVDNISSEFWTHITSFLSLLPNASGALDNSNNLYQHFHQTQKSKKKHVEQTDTEGNLRFLAVKIDFNSYYG